MPAPMKPMVDWGRVKRMHDEGVTAFQIERTFKAEGTPVSRQAIIKRGKKEGWIVGGRKTAIAKPARLKPPAPPVKPATPPPTIPLAAQDSDEAQRRADFIMGVREGLSLKWAAHRVRATADEAKAWLDADPSLKADYMQAVAENAFVLIGNIRAAASRGEFRAAALLLERHPETREDFIPASRGGSGPAVQVVLNIPWDKPEPIPIDAQPVPVIDVRPSEKVIERG